MFNNKYFQQLFKVIRLLYTSTLFAIQLRKLLQKLLNESPRVILTQIASIFIFFLSLVRDTSSSIKDRRLTKEKVYRFKGTMNTRTIVNTLMSTVIQRRWTKLDRPKPCEPLHARVKRTGRRGGGSLFWTRSRWAWDGLSQDFVWSSAVGNSPSTCFPCVVSNALSHPPFPPFISIGIYRVVRETVERGSSGRDLI